MSFAVKIGASSIFQPNSWLNPNAVDIILSDLYDIVKLSAHCSMLVVDTALRSVAPIGQLFKTNLDIYSLGPACQLRLKLGTLIPALVVISLLNDGRFRSFFSSNEL